MRCAVKRVFYWKKGKQIDEDDDLVMRLGEFPFTNEQEGIFRKDWKVTVIVEEAKK